MLVDGLTNAELVVIAVAMLGGHSRYVDREDIAIAVNGIVTGRFNWRKYPERIDLNVVADALRDPCVKLEGVAFWSTN